MSNIVPISKAGVVAFSDKDMALIRRTVAKDCNDDEFNLFAHMCKHLELDPLRRQIYAFVFSKDKPDKRNMSIVIAIDGFRSIADRTGNYRPDENEPKLEFDGALKGPTNPHGIVKATVRVWKYSHGEWHPITGIAYWEEFAPVKEIWAYDEGANKRQPTGRYELDSSGQWVKMGRHQIAKCAEAQAIRRGWPDNFANVYEHAEVDRARALDLLPSEIAAEGARLERQEKIGHKDSVPLTFADDGAIEMIPTGKVADRCFEFIEAHKEEPSQIILWSNRNRAGLREFWTRSPNDALEVKKALERAVGDPTP